MSILSTFSATATNSFPSPVGAMYVRKHFKETAKESMLEMVHDIRLELKKILDRVDWMDDLTRARAKVRTSIECTMYNVHYLYFLVFRAPPLQLTPMHLFLSLAYNFMHGFLKQACYAIMLFVRIRNGRISVLRAHYDRTI